MILNINTTEENKIILALKNESYNSETKKEIATERGHSEKILPEIEKMLEENNLNMSDLSKIVVANGKGSFSGLRSGIAIANAMAFALDIPVEDNDGRSLKTGDFDIVQPHYDRPPSITVSKK